MDRVVRNIFIILISIIIAVNIVIWVNSPQVARTLWGDLAWDPNLNYSGYKNVYNTQFVGFEWLFDRFSSFPGLKFCTSVTNNYLNIIGNYDITGNFILDFFLAIVRVFGAPMLLLVTFIMDVLNMIKWVFDLITNFGSGFVG